MFAPAYMGRKRRGAAPSNASAMRAKSLLLGGIIVPHELKAFEKTLVAHVRWCEHGAPVHGSQKTRYARFRRKRFVQVCLRACKREPSRRHFSRVCLLRYTGLMFPVVVIYLVFVEPVQIVF